MGKNSIHVWKIVSPNYSSFTSARRKDFFFFFFIYVKKGVVNYCGCVINDVVVLLLEYVYNLLISLTLKNVEFFTLTPKCVCV